KIMWVLFRIDALEEKSHWLTIDLLPIHQSNSAFEPLNATFVLRFVRHVRHDISGEDDHSRAGKLLHGRECIFQLRKKGIANGRVADTVVQPGCCVEADL